MPERSLKKPDSDDLGGDTEPDDDDEASQKPPASRPGVAAASAWQDKKLMQAVTAWLTTFGMGQYEPAFRENGFDDLMVIEELNEAVCVSSVAC